ncbi:DUF2269 family protein [Sediminivirga luteola]|uniref:Uncharacterized protein n=1 Tax=Sediminivirga luteola TaxID=1774748 RepID=A0A8J2XLQ5_9MICO|nr:DUF2269 family protein [Sediminivirga luteola]GGA20066.1 hypothetical protein GCM10011333_24000 [Sediminivirga luteola]
MSDFLLSVHVLGAILAIGPVAVTASMFPAAARRAAADPSDSRALAGARILHRITRVYAVIGVVVPVFGVATALSMGILTQAWLLVAMALTAVAAVVLIGMVLPGQRRVLQALEDRVPEQDRTPADEDGIAERDSAPAAGVAGPDTRRLAMTAGIFNLLWAVVVVMMIYRPGQDGYV